MAFSKDRLHKLEIACAIKRTSINALGPEWDCTGQWVRLVAQGEGVSERIEKNIDEFIEDAKKIVPFSYPTNGQTNGQNNNTKEPHTISG